MVRNMLRSSSDNMRAISVRASTEAADSVLPVQNLSNNKVTVIDYNDNGGNESPSFFKKPTLNATKSQAILGVGISSRDDGLDRIRQTSAEKCRPLK